MIEKQRGGEKKCNFAQNRAKKMKCWGSADLVFFSCEKKYLCRKRSLLQTLGFLLCTLASNIADLSRNKKLLGTRLLEKHAVTGKQWQRQ